MENVFSTMSKWMHCNHKDMNMVYINTQVGCAFKLCSFAAKGHHKNIAHTITVPPAAVRTTFFRYEIFFLLLTTNTQIKVVQENHSKSLISHNLVQVAWLLGVPQTTAHSAAAPTANIAVNLIHFEASIFKMAYRRQCVSPPGKCPVCQITSAAQILVQFNKFT